MRVEGADIGHLELVDQKLGELEDFGRELFYLVEELPVVYELRGHRVELADHTDAGARRRHNSLVASKDLHKAPDERYGFPRVAGVEVHLAAAGLLEGEVYLVPEAFQELYGCPSGLRKERIVEARDKERHTHGQLAPQIVSLLRYQVISCPAGEPVLAQDIA